LPDWVDTSPDGFAAAILAEGGPNVTGKIRNIYRGENQGTIIEFIPGLTPTATQKANMKLALKKLFTEVIEETVEVPG
jgi:hypothetical protein